MPRRPSRKGLVKKLDAAFSRYIRALEGKRTGHCFFCPRPIEDCFHIITRSKYAVRWDPRNAVGSCKRDNFINEQNPHPYILKYICSFGLDEYDLLLRDSNKIAKFENYQLQEKAAQFAQLEKGLVNG